MEEKLSVGERVGLSRSRSEIGTDSAASEWKTVPRGRGTTLAFRE